MRFFLIGLAAFFLAAFALAVFFFAAGFLRGPLITDSYSLINSFAGLRRTASPTTASGTSSSFLKRTHAIPMSSFLPASAQAFCSHFNWAELPYMQQRWSDM